MKTGVHAQAWAFAAGLQGVAKEHGAHRIYKSGRQL